MVFAAILEFVSAVTMGWITLFGYFGIFVAMALESACLPVPSEIVMPFGGYFAFLGRLDFWLVTLAGTLGCLAGSLVAYYVGLKGGRPLLRKYGKYVLISERELKWAEDWFRKWGNKAIFVSRLLPVIRTVISLPAGIARMPIRPFIVYTFVGSLPWCAALAYAGYLLGENWEEVGGYFHNLDLFVMIAVVAAAAYLLWRYKIRKAR